jgi:hypothetical protein
VTVFEPGQDVRQRNYRQRRSYSQLATAAVAPGWGRRDAHAKVKKIAAGSIPAPFDFSNFEESFLDRSGPE